MFPCLKGLPVAGKHSGDLGYAIFPVDFDDGAFVATATNDIVLLGQGGDGRFVSHEKNLTASGKVTQFLAGEKGCPSPEAGFHFIEDEAFGRFRVGQAQLKGEKNAAQLSS